MRENDARRALDEMIEERDRINRDAERHARRAEQAEAELATANERIARWTAAYERLEAKLANARIKAKALADALR